MRIRPHLFLLVLIPFASHAQTQTPPKTVTSHIVVYDMQTGKEREVWTGKRHFEAPNWSRDGKYLLLNSQGKLWKLPAEGGDPQQVDTGTVERINNDHGIAPDGKQIAISAGEIYLLPEGGGTPKQITNAKPSYYHGWSPDGKWLAFCAQRDKNFDLYRISVDGGAEQRLTSHAEYDDGPDYSPDGKWIYFNSNRSGSWDVWRIPAEGAGENDAKAERVTSDDMEDWFPHPSPDGKWFVIVSFKKGTTGHPANQDVVLRKFAAPGNGKPNKPVAPQEFRKLFGGQGTINVNSWAPDSRHFAFVWYEVE